MSDSRWDEQEDYDAPVFVFPDDEEDSGYESVPVVFDDDEPAAASAPPASAATPEQNDPAEDFEYDMRRRDSDFPGHDEWDEVSTVSHMRRSSRSSEPVKYPEGSLGAFSTPEDYERHGIGQDSKDSAGDAFDSDIDEDEYDSPIMLFPPDEVDDYEPPAPRGNADTDRDSEKEDSRPRLSSSTRDGDLDDSIGISFSRYSAEAKEGEFFFMPFLDIPDEPEEDEEEEQYDEGEEISFSFRKVDAEQVKKEREFVFMPFLNISEEAEEEEEEEEDELHVARRGMILDEGLYLIPLESEEEEEAPQEEEKEPESEEEDSGIYVVSSVGGVVPKAPKAPRSGEIKTSFKDVAQKPAQGKKKKSSSQKQGSSSGKKSQSGSGSSSSKNKSVEDQFRAAMRNVSPEIRAAVKNDPVQRAALEQAVRIALVQQAAQEAVEKATGRPVFGGSSAASSGTKKKKRPPRPPQRQSSSTRAGGMSFSPITLRTPYDDGGVSEFGVPAESSTSTTSTLGFGSTQTTQTTPAAQSTAGTAGTAGSAGSPDANQDPILSLLNGTASEPDAEQDPILAAAKRAAAKGSGYQSPAAVRAAMRSGMDYEAPQPAAAPPSRPMVSAAEQEEQAKRSGCLMWVIVAFVAFFVGLICILVLPNISKQNRYDEAVSLMESGKYLQAITQFETFNSGDTKYYSDSRANISECAYLQASLYYSEGNYYDAYNLLIDKAQITEETTDLLLRAGYSYAEEKYAEGDWQTAATAYSNLLSQQYADSREKYNICNYQIALEQEEAGNYLQAYQTYALLGSYSDAQIRSAVMIYDAWNVNAGSVTLAQLEDAIGSLKHNTANAEAQDTLSRFYSKAADLVFAGEYTTAYIVYRAMGNYANAEYDAAVTLYNVWSINPNYGTLTEREDAMQILSENLDLEAASVAISSSGFNPVRILGKWSDGNSYMSCLRTEAAYDDLTLVLELESDGSTVFLETDSIGFDGNVIYRLTDPENPDSRELLFELRAFDSITSVSPGTLSFYCFLNGREYTMVRG